MDIIDQLAGITPGSPLDSLRSRRPEARTHAQASFAALFMPAEPGGVTTEERFALACFVIGLHDDAATEAYYAAHLTDAALLHAVQAAAAAARTSGPYGHYPAGPLSAEDTDGPTWQADAGPLGARLAAAFAHAHMLVFHPRDAAPETLAAMLAAGWTTTDIVTLSQIVAFLTFQIRVVAGFRVMQGAA